MRNGAVGIKVRVVKRDLGGQKESGRRRDGEKEVALVYCNRSH